MTEEKNINTEAEVTEEVTEDTESPAVEAVAKEVAETDEVVAEVRDQDPAPETAAEEVPVEENAPEVAEVPAATATESVEMESVETASSDEPAADEPTTGESISKEKAESDSNATAEKASATKEAKATAPPPVELKPEIAALDKARKQRKPVAGKVIGWNQGGFHVAIGEVPAFCPRSAIALGEPEEPESYLNQEFDFTVLEIRKGGKRIVVSRAGAIRAERSAQRKQVLAEIRPGAVLTGSVASLTDFGAFVDLGGVQGLLHVSEISRSRINHPSDALEEGQEIEVKVLKVEKGGKRISLSRKALEPDPWQAIDDFEEGQEIEGKVERAEKFGVLVEIAPGLSGLIPSSALSLPADASPKRVFPGGKELKVQIVSIDKRRKRISLLPEGAQVDGSKKDLDEYRQRHGEQKLGALAAAFEKARGRS